MLISLAAAAAAAVAAAFTWVQASETKKSNKLVRQQMRTAERERLDAAEASRYQWRAHQVGSSVLLYNIGTDTAHDVTVKPDGIAFAQGPWRQKAGSDDPKEREYGEDTVEPGQVLRFHQIMVSAYIAGGYHLVVNWREGSRPASVPIEPEARDRPESRPSVASRLRRPGA